VETSDKQFFLTFMGVLGALVLISVLVLVAAQLLGGIGQSGEKSAAQIRIAKERIEPVGKLNLQSNPDQPAAVVADVSAVQEASAEDVDPGKKAYSGICQSCHLVGVAGAPKLGDVEAWRPRIAQGMNALYAAVINGKGVMPPKGGAATLSDADIRAAVDYMVEASR
jgi:cytochrome c5